MVSRAFGLTLSFEAPLPGAWAVRPVESPDLEVRSVTGRAIADIWSGRAELGWQAPIDGVAFAAERGRAGDHLFQHGGHPVSHLSADAKVLRCAPAAGEPLGWRVILDSVLFSVALIAGYEALHAGAVATDDGAVAITAPAGGGKSTLLAELLRGGSALLADDIVVLEAGSTAPLAHPGPPLMTVPEAVAPALGAPIGCLGGERWIGVPTYPRAIPLVGLVVLSRVPGLATGLQRVGDPFGVLMTSLLRYPRSPRRERSRFEMAAAIASQVPVWELRADPEVDPESLAILLRAGLARHAASPGPAVT